MKADFEEAKGKTETWDALWVLTALDMNDIGSWELDLSDNTAKRTPAHDRIFGYSEMLDEWTYERFLGHVVPEDRARVDRSLQDGIARQAMWWFDCRIRRVDGEVRWIFSAGRPLFDSKGQLCRYIGTVRDITVRKSIEAQLMEAQKLEAVGQLTAGVSHYFNNLLAVVMANIDMLRDMDGMPAAAQPLIKSSLRAVERGAAMNRQLLAFARKWALAPRMVDLGEEMRHVAAGVRRSLPQNVQLQVLVTPQPIPVLVDTGQLNQAIVNLANNAHAAMKEEGVLLVSVGIEDREATAAAAAHRYGVVTVQDTGCGMTAEVMAKAFDPFFTTREVGEGTGLGLSMVHGFMEQSQGHVELSSAVGEGTTVKLLFPLAAGRLEEIAPS